MARAERTVDFTINSFYGNRNLRLQYAGIGNRGEEILKTKAERLLIYEQDRIFIDVAYRGCGNGCKYCYVESAADKQELADYSDLDAVCDFILNWPLCKAPIISFCPRTEPFKSVESARRVLYVVKQLTEYAYCFQISTKEEILPENFEMLSECSKQKPIFINVSVPVLKTEVLEPFAADLSARIKNFRELRKFPNFYGGLYIKPLFAEAISSVDRYIELAAICNPHYICAGVQFTKKIQNPCISLYDAGTAKDLLNEQKDGLFRFSAEIKRSVSCIVVYSSVCAINQLLKKERCLTLWQYQPECCKSCELKR